MIGLLSHRILIHSTAEAIVRFSFLITRVGLLLFLTFVHFNSYSQTPGGTGTANLQLWLKAGSGTNTTTQGANVTTWTDQSPVARAITQGTPALQPTYNSTSNLINFNPSISFNGSQALSFSNFTGLPTGAAQRSVFAVATSNNFSGNKWIFSYGTQNANENCNIGMNSGTGNPMMGHWGLAYDVFQTTGTPFSTVPIMVNGGYDGTNKFISSNARANTTLNQAPNTIILDGYVGRLSGGGATEYWNGSIAEIIYYDVAPSAAFTKRIHTYLAIKYGITLDQTVANDYVASNGTTTLWSAAANGIYNNDITVIGRDDNSGLNQKQSASANSDDIVTAGLTTIEATNDANTATFPVNLRFFAWANNNGSVNAWTTTESPGVCYQRVQREWRVQQSGNVGAMTFRVPETGGVSNLPPIADGSIYMLYDLDGDFTAGATILPMTKVGNNWEVSVDLNDGHYFTFANTVGPIISLIPTSGLIANYQLKGNAYDQTVTNHGTFQGGTPTPTTDRFGNANAAYTFNGSTQYMSTSVLYNNPSNFSLCLWFKTTTSVGGRLIGFGQAQTGTSGSRDRMVWMRNDGKLIFGVNPSFASKIITTNEAYNDGNWHQVIATCSNTAGTNLYMDGVLVGSNAAGLGGETYSGYWRINYDGIGWANSPSSLYFNGSMDDILIYNREITPAEVTTLFTNANGAGNNLGVCNGGTLNLTAATVGGATYAWTGPNGFSSASQNPSITNMSAAKEGTYTVTVSNNGCITSSAYTLEKINYSLGPTISALPTTGIISNYKLDGNASDSTNTNPGTLQNSPTLTNDRFGNANKAYLFNGSSQYISTSIPYTNPADLTISIWFKTSTTSGGKLIGFGNAMTGPSSSYDRHIYMNNAGQIYCGVFIGSVKSLNSTASYNDGIWHLATISISSSNGLKLYMDGNLIGSDPSGTGGEPFTGYWRIGYEQMTGWPSMPSSNYFNGAIDDVRIYNNALTSLEISTLYHHSGDVSSNSPVCSGTTINLSAPTVAGGNYTWTGPNTFSSASQNPTRANASAADAGIYSLTVTTASGCTSTGQTNVQILTTPTAPTGTGAAICGTGTLNLSASGSPSDYKWYDAATLGSLVYTGTPFTTPSISTTTTYYVSAISAAGCESAARTSVIATINTIPAAPTGIDGANCGTGMVNLSASGSPSDYKWYDALTAGTLLGTGVNYTTPSISTTTTYYVSAISAASCESTTRTAVIANINTIPSAPAGTGGSNCGTGTVNLSASGSTTYKWYDASAAGTLLYTGTPYTTPSISISTTYYVSAISAASCESATRTAVVATIKSIPSPPSGTGGATCGTGTINLSASGSSSTYKWYDASTLGTLLSTGANYTTPSISGTTTYYVSAISDSSCESATRTAVVATIHTIPAAPSGTGDAICGPGTVNLSASGSPLDYNWYDASSAGTLVQTGATYSPAISTTTTYYVSAVSSFSCESATRTAVTGTINIIPSAPTGTGASRCDNGTVILNASGSPSSYNWYDALTGGTLLGSGSAFTTPSISTSTNYFVSALSGASCESASRTLVTATIVTTPSLPVIADTNICGNGSLSLSTDGIAPDYRWYNVAAGGSIIGSGSPWTSTLINRDTIFYVSALDGSCESGRKQVTITYFPGSVAGTISSSAANVCSGTNSGTLTLSSYAGNVIRWLYSSDNFITQDTIASTNSVESFSNLALTTSYKAMVQNGSCPAATSSAKTIVADPITNPGTLTITNATPDGGTLELSGFNGTILNWQVSIDSFNTAAPISETSPQLNFNNGQIAYYRVVVQSGTCPSDTSDFIAIGNFNVYTSVSPNGDGINDSWTIRGIDAYGENRVSIYNRWGDLVYKETNYNNIDRVWKGHSNTGFIIDNGILPEGTYFYQIEIGNLKAKTGYVVIKK